ncbi:MAG: hypothetical protein E4H27_02090 [Anaerolineales bacterium]|nr:MAG: hypothetical protein E4H27_02090 [Anaerolineales bacterium]
MTQEKDVRTLLAQIARKIGPGIRDISFALHLDGGALTLGAERFDLSSEITENGNITFSGQWRDICVFWTFTPMQDGYWIKLAVQGADNLKCASADSLILTYRPDNGNILDWRAPTIQGYMHVGMVRIRDLPEEALSGAMLRGAFADSQQPGLFLGTYIPQSCLHTYRVLVLDKNAVRFTCNTAFTHGIGESNTLTSESTWVCGTKTVHAAMNAYASHIPTYKLASPPPVGWNSWDYYYSSVSLDDLIENMDAIQKDPVLAERIKIIVVDMGWYHTEGEWYPNFRFPGGLERVVSEITRRGFIPGIWTAPIAVNWISRIAWRKSEMLVKNAYGDPVKPASSGWYILDPTHPMGQEFLRELYSRLYEVGFRFFKVDYVSELLNVQRFNNPMKGPYDALRDLFSIIRDCVTEESHILGCSLPEECGPGVADSGRIGIDIHNQWTHVEWVMDNLQLKYWLHNRVWISDPDFLVVRGKHTSLEKETNVMNPEANNPSPPRWRRGPVFTLDEAQTWANIVSLSGGSLFLSDRIAMLNDAGINLLHKLTLDRPTGVSAYPLDLCDEARPSLWLQELDDMYRLGIINWSDQAQTKVFVFDQHRLESPGTLTDVWSGVEYSPNDGKYVLELAPHASVLLSWTRQGRMPCPVDY